ncbi:MAG: amidohydrolase family protein [Acidobacteria bacterium]|nr:amidohydrolase family protein [Acidobacteriota bacterium]
MLIRVFGSIVLLCVTAVSLAANPTGALTDGHVHILSPELIKIWKGLGIPFSRPDEYYSDIDVILRNTAVRRIDLISMAHVFSSEDFGGFQNERELVEKENSFVAAARDKHPKKVRAFCSIDPLREYALAELERCRTQLKMDGIKLHHNASQVYLTVPEHLEKVKSVFEFAAENKMPILMHFDNSHRRFGKPDIDLLVGSILKELRSVELRIAHFGTSGGFSQRTRAFLNAFIEELDAEPGLRKHKITFDISAVALDKDSEGIRKLTDDEFAVLAKYIRRLGLKRIAFGTDYPLYTPAEYEAILRTRVGLSERELEILLKTK